MLTWSKRTTSEKMSPIGRSCLTTSVLILKGMLATTCIEATKLVHVRLFTKVGRSFGTL